MAQHSATAGSEQEQQTCPLEERLKITFKHLTKNHHLIAKLLEKAKDVAVTICTLFQKQKEVTIKCKLRKYKFLLQEALAKAEAFVLRLNKMCDFADLSNEKTIADSMTSGNSDKFNEFVKQILHYIKQAGKLHLNFEEARNKAESACTEGVGAAHSKLEEAKSQGNGKIKYGLGFLASSVAAATVCGIVVACTGGLAAPLVPAAIGLFVTAAGTGTTGTVLTVAGTLSRRTKEELDSIRQIERSFDEMSKLAAKINVSVLDCSVGLKDVKLDAKSLEVARKTVFNEDMLKLLLETIKKTQETCKNARVKLQAIKQELADIE